MRAGHRTLGRQTPARAARRQPLPRRRRGHRDARTPTARIAFSQSDARRDRAARSDRKRCEFANSSIDCSSTASRPRDLPARRERPRRSAGRRRGAATGLPSADESIGHILHTFFTADDQQRDAPEQELQPRPTITGRARKWRDGGFERTALASGATKCVRPSGTESGELRGLSKSFATLPIVNGRSSSANSCTPRRSEANRLKDEFLGTVSHELRTR